MMPMRIHNPIIPGFNPDPCICRSGDDYYIATSTFEWFPGVPIYQSRDLVHWRLCAHALTRVSQLDLAGAPPSGGIWAPCLSFADGKFWLIYTVVHTVGHHLDLDNYLVTAERVEGPWSEPKPLGKVGFDPSLFHDDDGRKYLVVPLLDSRPNESWFSAITLREYAPATNRFVTPLKRIFTGSPQWGGVCEGPHLYKHDGWYYLMTAEGGTGEWHAVSLARSRRIEGPYEVHPRNPILHARDRKDLPLQKTGHASLVETSSGEWYLSHLCARPIGEHRRCVLGRETAIQKVAWDGDGWLRLADGSDIPKVEVPAPNLKPYPFPPEPATDDFDSPMLGVHWSTLRYPVDTGFISLAERPGWLRLRARGTLNSFREQSFVARRIDAMTFEVSTVMQAEPRHCQHAAGLVLFYSDATWLYLHLTRDEKMGPYLTLVVNDKYAYREPAGRIPVVACTSITLGARFANGAVQFRYAVGGELVKDMGPVLDATILSDEYQPRWAFTGAFVGIAAQDTAGDGFFADFDRFTYAV